MNARSSKSANDHATLWRWLFSSRPAFFLGKHQQADSELVEMLLVAAMALMTSSAYGVC